MALSATSGTIAPFPKHQFLDENGDPYNGGLLFTYEPGTTTKKATYTDQATTVANTNPIVLDSAGRATIFLVPTESYKFVLAPSTDTDPPASAIWTVDSVSALAGGVTGLQVAGTAGEALSLGEVCYLSDGSGSLTAGRWYKTDADNSYSSSLAKLIGVAVTDIASGSTGAFSIGGRLTGGSGYTTGAVYYISSTAGAVTSTRPTGGGPGVSLGPARAVAVADSASTLIMVPTDIFSGISRYEAGIIANTGNVGTGEDTLASYNYKASQIAADGQGIKATFWGSTTNNANAKTLRIRIDDTATDTSIADVSLSTNEAGDWIAEIIVLRATSTTARSCAWVKCGPGGSATTVDETQVSAFNCTWANAVEVRVTGEATTNDDITIDGGVLMYLSN